MAKHTKNTYKATLHGYEITVRDYKYKSQPPVGVRVSGTRLGECQNLFGEPCYFYECRDAYSMTEGIEIAQHIVQQRLS